MARMSTFFCDVLFLLLLSLSKHCFQDSNEISAYTRSQTRATAGRHINSFIARPTSDAQLFQLRETTSKHARLSRIERIRKQILSPIVHLPFSLSLSSSASRERKRDLISISLSLSLLLPCSARMKTAADRDRWRCGPCSKRAVCACVEIERYSVAERKRKHAGIWTRVARSDRCVLFLRI